MTNLYLCLPKEIITIICTGLTEKERIYFLSTCRYLNSLKNIFLYHTLVDSLNIADLWYYNQFTNIIFSNNLIKKIIDNEEESEKKIIYEKINFPANLSHLRIDWFQGDLNYIASSLNTITHLYIVKHTHLKRLDRLNFKLPDTLVHLIWKIKQKLPVKIIPLGLKELCINSIHDIDNLPSHLDCLIIYGKIPNKKNHKNYYINFYYPQKNKYKGVITVPLGIKKLVLHQHNCTNIPKSVTELEINYSPLVLVTLPENLVSLKLDELSLRNSWNYLNWNIKMINKNNLKRLIVPKSSEEEYVFETLTQRGVKIIFE